MSLYNDFLDWQQRITALLLEGEELSQRLQELEIQHAALQKKLVNGSEGGGFDALSSLYNDGFHICPANFGEKREEDCLFCLNFLLHKGKRG